MRAALFDVARGVARLLRSGLAHENMCTKRRQNAFFGFFDGCLVCGKVLSPGILDDDVFEAGLFQNSPRLGWQNQVGACAILRPWQGIVRISLGTQTVLGERKEGAWLQDSKCFSKK